MLTACNTVQQTIAPASRIARPVEAVYRFENVRRLGGLDEWASIRRILELHAKGSVSATPSNERRYESAEIRDYEARLVLTDVADLQKIQTALDDLSKQTINGQKARFSMMRAEIDYRSLSAGSSQDTIVRGVTSPASFVRLYLSATESVDTNANQYGAWAKSVKVRPNAQWVYGYSEGGVGATTTRRYFRVDVFTGQEEPISEQQFNTRLQ
ncbi:MAG: hypothetical protein H7210_10455 [Pyrinomonadaceae bacterium]|nr:hypothetical protein [Phycisphaerales bacterium]